MCSAGSGLTFSAGRRCRFCWNKQWFFTNPFPRAFLSCFAWCKASPFRILLADFCVMAGRRWMLGLRFYLCNLDSRILKNRRMTKLRPLLDYRKTPPFYTNSQLMSQWATSRGLIINIHRKLTSLTYSNLLGRKAANLLSVRQQLRFWWLDARWALESNGSSDR